MKKVIPAILLLFILVNILQSQNIDGRIQVENNDGVNLVVKFQIALDQDSASLGNTVSRLQFDQRIISYADNPKILKDFEFHNFEDGFYLSNVSQPTPGILSINIVNFNGGSELVRDDFVDVATLKFTLNSSFKDTAIIAGLQQFFSPSSTSLWNFGSLSVSELGEEYVPKPIFPFNNAEFVTEEIYFKWTKIEGAQKYDLQISSDQGFKTVDFSVDEINDTIVTVKEFKEGVQYYWRVRSVMANGKSHYSRQLACAIAIKPPSGLNAAPSSVRNGQFVELSWQNNSNSSDQIVIERKLADSDEDFAVLDTISSSRNSYLDALVQDTETYLYRIHSINEDVASQFSDSTQITLSQNDLEEDNNLPDDFQLQQNYPNPFNPQTTINYSVKENSRITISVYSMIGEKIETLIDQVQDAGNYNVSWNALNYASGIYIYIMTAESNTSNNNFKNVKKMMLLK